MTLSILSGCGKAAETTTPETKAPETVVETTTPEKTNATYTASAADFDERGWKAELSLTYEDDKIVKIEYDEVNKDGLKKSEDEAYAKMMKDVTKISPAEAYAKLIETALNEDKVDVVTGATTATTAFKALYEEAKAQKK